MKQLLLALLLFAVASSCTIEKRLYNRGWNVQWRKHDRASTDKTIEAQNTNRQSKEGLERKTSAVDESSNKNPNTKEIAAPQDQSKPADQFENSAEPIEIPAYKTGDNEDDFKRTKSEPKPDPEKESDGDRSLLFSILLIVLTGICVGLMYLCYIAAISTSHWGWALLSVLGMITFCALGIVLLVMAIVLLIGVSPN